jgi:hypothetical protein
MALKLNSAITPHGFRITKIGVFFELLKRNIRK